MVIVHHIVDTKLVIHLKSKKNIVNTSTSSFTNTITVQKVVHVQRIDVEVEAGPIDVPTVVHIHVVEVEIVHIVDRNVHTASRSRDPGRDRDVEDVLQEINVVEVVPRSRKAKVVHLVWIVRNL